jgi:hypothetical protein
MSGNMSQAEVQDAGSGFVRLHCLGHVSTSGDDYLSQDWIGHSLYG